MICIGLTLQVVVVMSSLCYDPDGNPINTDILVSGYIEKLSKALNKQIPSDITRVCFLVLFIDVWDEWDKSLCNEFVVIKDSCFTLRNDYIEGKDGVYCCTAFGTSHCSK